MEGNFCSATEYNGELCVRPEGHSGNHMSDDFTVWSTSIPGHSAILQEASDLLGGDRQDSYGDPSENFERIATMISAYLGHPVTPSQVAVMMVLIKVSRLASSPDHADSFIDMAAYSALAGSLRFK